MQKFTIRKLSISRIHNEVMLVYRGRDNIYVKKFSLSISRLYHRILYFAGASALTLALVIALPIGGKQADSSTPEDEELKNDILLSEETNFTEPDKRKPLSVQVYKVKQGDTLSEIAAKFGVSTDTICGSSGLTSYDYLKIGQTLKIPDRDGLLVTVKDGQKLIDIAQKYKIPVDKIMAQNQLLNPDFLPVGYDLFLPDAKPQNIIPGFMWPTISRRITSAYGWRIHPINGRRRFHNGLDIRSRYQNIKASKYGKVTFSGSMGGYGRAIIIAHPGGKKTLYAHLSRSYVKKGQYVKQGQVIAKSGNSGYSSGPHLHFEIIRNGKHVNPRRLLK
ncbi:MAG: M23 family metallopeptidase [Spirochaetes bacterium]|jgi:murein DD-endopeptidase MepM/ murein hydrolase activator NlpD|nr:M23 family metallopeptidase [Spirochaetota bacterium]